MKGELSYRQTVDLAEAMAESIGHPSLRPEDAALLKATCYRFCLQYFNWSTGEPDDVFERAVSLGIKANT